MTVERIESVEEIKERIAAAEAEKQAEVDKKLAEFDKRVTAPLAAKKAAAQEEQKERDKQLQKQRAEAFDKQHRGPALAAWMRSGGSQEEFEQQWPDMREKMQVREALKADTRTEQWRRSAARRYR